MVCYIIIAGEVITISTILFYRMYSFCSVFISFSDLFDYTSDDFFIFSKTFFAPINSSFIDMTSSYLTYIWLYLFYFIIAILKRIEILSTVILDRCYACSVYFSLVWHGGFMSYHHPSLLTTLPLDDDLLILIRSYKETIIDSWFMFLSSDLLFHDLIQYKRKCDSTIKRCIELNNFIHWGAISIRTAVYAWGTHLSDLLKWQTDTF